VALLVQELAKAREANLAHQSHNAFLAVRLQ
jgi:hypothetical protein